MAGWDTPIGPGRWVSVFVGDSAIWELEHMEKYVRVPIIM